MNKPDWDFWRNKLEVALWQAVMLSMGADPDAIDPDDDYFEENREASKRLRLLCDNLSKRECFSAGTLSLRHPSLCGVQLSEFAAWAADVVHWTNLPPELLAMAKKPEAAPTTAADDQRDDDAGDSGASPDCAVFREMPNLHPREVTIEIAAGEDGYIVLEISARSARKRVSLGEIGLFDRRGAKPNTQYGLLLGMAKGDRVRHKKPSHGQQISRLRKILKKHLGLSRDPFAPYQRAVGYEPLFTLLDKRDTGDQRAKRDASANTVSFNEAQHGADYPYTNDDMQDEPGTKWLQEND